MMGIQPVNEQLLKSALICAAQGWAVFALGERSKTPDGTLSPNGFKSSTKDEKQVRALWAKSPNANIGIALGESDLIVLDFDNGEIPPELLARLPETLMVKTARGVHVYFNGTCKSSKLVYNGETLGDIKSTGGYVLAPFSQHPDGPTYTVFKSAPVAQAPIELIESLQVKHRLEDTPRGANNLIEHGHIHDALVSHAGKLRHLGHSVDLIETALLEWAHKNCAAPINESQVKQVARSFAKYPEGQSHDLIMSQTPAAPAGPAQEIDTSQSAARPTFPLWALEGTSLFDGLVAPTIASSSKHAEFIAMPAIQVFLNYLSLRVKVGSLSQHQHHNLFLGLVSPPGQHFKSSSVALTFDYYSHMGVLASDSASIKNADGKIIVLQSGSPEGFGLKAAKLNAPRAILYNDELSKFVSKAGIETSSFASDVLSWYEGQSFGNNTSVTKNHFAWEPKSYIFGWLFCTTVRGFDQQWPKLSKMESGLVDRMFFVVTPENPNPTAPYRDPAFEGAVRTRQLLDKAIAQGVFEFEDSQIYAQRVAGMEPRQMAMVEKLALYFAVDTGSDCIDGDHIDRAVALVEYANQAKEFLSPIEAENTEARLQLGIKKELRRHGGKMKYRDLCRNLAYHQYGIFVWGRAYDPMVRVGVIFEFQEQITPGKRPSRMVGLAKEED